MRNNKTLLLSDVFDSTEALTHCARHNVNAIVELAHIFANALSANARMHLNEQTNKQKQQFFVKHKAAQSTNKLKINKHFGLTRTFM